MSDQYSDTSDDGQSDEDFKNLRAKAKKADVLERENQTLKRDMAFVKAGVPMDDPRMSYFVKGYDGDLEPSAIKQAAIDAGFMPAPTQQVDPVVQQAQAGQAAVMNAASGVVPSFDESAVDFQMEEAYAQGGLEGLSAVAQQYGVTFNTPEI
jgi:hypothetical protein